MLEDISAMAVTIEVEVNGGSTVRLTYDGGQRRGVTVPFTSIMVGERAAARLGGWSFEDVVEDALVVLLLYVRAKRTWPAELRSPQTPHPA